MTQHLGLRAFAVAICLTVGSASQAVLVTTLSPTDIHGGDTNTASFSNADLTITPFVGGVASTFNSLSARLGVDVTGTTNVNAFNDPDTTAGNSDDETMVMAFGPLAGLSQITWDFSRGVLSFSGFSADPNAVLSGTGAGSAFVSTSFAGDTLTVSFNPGSVGGGLFVNPDTVLDLDFAASLGSTITVAANDSAQAGAQLAVTSISYSAVPEPVVIPALFAAGAAVVGRRRRGVAND